jgi:hypothetical protein
MRSATQKFGSDVRGDLNIQPGEDGPRRRSKRVEPDESNNEEVPIPEDTNTEPIVEPDKVEKVPASGDQDPPKGGEGGTDPLKDPASDPSLKPEVPPTDPKKPKDDKTKKPVKPIEAEMSDAEVCADSGLIATRYCPETINKKFQKGKKPKRRCTVHKAPDESGGGN